MDNQNKDKIISAFKYVYWIMRISFSFLIRFICDSVIVYFALLGISQTLDIQIVPFESVFSFMCYTLPIICFMYFAFELLKYLISCGRRRYELYIDHDIFDIKGRLIYPAGSWILYKGDFNKEWRVSK